MNLPTTSVQPTSFTPESGLPCLRTDPTMQHREAFANTWRLRLNERFLVMAPTFPAGTEILLTRVAGPSELQPGAVYLLEEDNIPESWRGPAPARQTAMARLVQANRCREHRTHPFAEMVMRYDNEQEATKCSTDSEGNFYWMAHFNGFGGRHLAKLYPTYRCTIWRVTHYIAPPAHADAFNFPEVGMSPTQQRWYEEERALLAAGPELVTAYSTGLDYAPTLEHLLDEAQATLLAEFLADVPMLPRSRAQKRKSPVVALTRRTCTGSATHFYAQEAIAPVLDLLDGLRRERTSREALTRQISLRRETQRLSALETPRELALAA